MKRYIYIILFVFASLFCQAFGAQNEPFPTTTICAKLGDTVRMIDYQESIQKLLENKEKETWSGCCDEVVVDVQSAVHSKGESITLENWPAVIVKKDAELTIEVTYERQLRCTNIPRCKEDTKSETSLAMWHLFGKLLSETDTELVTTISDVATVTTLHKAMFSYKVELAFPENIDFKIQGDSCFDAILIQLEVPDEYYNSCHLKWIIPKGVKNWMMLDTIKMVMLQDMSNDYLYPIICTATACNGEPRSDTIFIGKPTPTPEIDDLGCIAANDTSFEVNVNNSNSQLSYHWTLEDFGNGTIVDTQQGASVTMRIPQKEAVKLKLVSTGGCRDAEMEPMILHRSLVSEAHHIEMEAEPLCIFEGDTLRFSLPEAPEDTLVWQIADNKEMLTPHDIYNYQAVQAKDNVVISVYAKTCPDNKITDTFNIREDFKVSLGTSPMCIRANEYQVIGLTSNGINPEVHWYGNGIELDTTSYSPKDSISLRLTNPGDKNLYVKVTAAECGRERDTLLVLRPKPETPSLDPLSEKLTSCVPLGIDTTIELRVQPQERVKFRWSILEKEITEFDSNSIQVRVNYDLAERNAPIPVSVYAYTDGCPNGSDALQDTLYATGAGLDEEWHLLQENLWNMNVSYIFGFSNNDMLIDDGFTDPFSGMYSFYWYKDCENKEESPSCYYSIVIENDLNLPPNLFCKLTNVEQCYSVYSIEVVDMLEQQDVLFAAKKGGEDVATGRRNGTEALLAQASFEKEDTPCPGIVLHPNPVHAGVQVNVEGICETESFTVECYSSQGRLMFRTTAKGDTFTLPTDNYAAGVYIVKIQLNGAAAPIVKKLIIL